MKITVSGVVGAGKTTVSKILANEFSVPYIHIGSIQEKIAKERGVSFDELSKIARTDKSIDKEIDRIQAEMNVDDSSFVMDSRLGFYVIPNSYKVCLTVDLEEGARRIFDANRERQKYSSYEECLAAQIQRIDNETTRYRNAYGIELQDESLFDLVLDTTELPVEEVSNRILDSVGFGVSWS